MHLTVEFRPIRPYPGAHLSDCGRWTRIVIGSGASSGIGWIDVDAADDLATQVVENRKGETRTPREVLSVPP